MRASSAGRFFLLLALAPGLACDDDEGLGGPPELVKFLVQVPNEPDLDLLQPPDGGVPAVSGAASLRLVFNRLLDGDKIETVTNGMVMEKTDVVTAAWVNAPAGAPAIVAKTQYDPSGALAVNIPGPKVLVAFEPGLPSGAQVTIRLDRTKITSKGGAGFTGPDTQTLSTEPFGVSLNAMANDVVPSMFMAQLRFTNLPAMSAASLISLTAGGGAAVPVMVAGDASDPRILNVAPMPGWVPGESYTLTVDDAASDRLGVKLAADYVARFSVAGPDGGLAAPDGGADGGLGEAGVDGGAAADGPAGADAATDGGAEDAGADAGAGG
jgi:hypothetical protein